jgi:hypothetical protein
VLRALAATALLAASLVAASCGDGPPAERSSRERPATGPTPRERFANALIATRRAGSAAVSEHLVSEPRQLEWEITGRTRFDRNEAVLDIVHQRHPVLAPGTGFHIVIDFSPYVRRTNGRWYVPPFHSGEFELSYRNFVYLIGRAYGRVAADGPETLLVWMSRANLTRLRETAEGAEGPLGTLYDLIGPMRFQLDDEGRIERMEYMVTGRYFWALTPAHRVRVSVEFSDFKHHFDVEPPPGNLITPGPLKPPQPGARAEISRL